MLMIASFNKICILNNLKELNTWLKLNIKFCKKFTQCFAPILAKPCLNKCMHE